MAVVVITGANRGIGLELARQLSERGDRVIAGCRTPSAELEALDVQVVAGVEVTSDESVGKLVHAVGDAKVDILINNAGIMRRDSFSALDFGAMRDQFEVNTLGPLRVTHAFADSMAQPGKVIVITSRMGSIADNTSGGAYGYRASKAAVNMVATSLAHDLQGRGVAVALLHPGMVATEMTGGNGISPVESATGLIARIDALSAESSGTFWHQNGQVLPW